MSNGGIAYYLYCLTPRAGAVHVSAIGVDGERPVFVHACGEIGAVISEVALAEFSGELAEARLQDLAYLGPLVWRHEAVIDEAMRQAPVTPARFATLFTSVDRLQQYVLEHQSAINGFFAQLGDKQEWAVKGLLHPPGALETLSSSGESVVEGRAPVTSPGARYLQEKRIKAQLEQDFNLRLKEFCQRAATALGTQSDGFRERKVLGSMTAETDAKLVLNWAFLLSPAAIEDFRVRLDGLNGGEAFTGLILVLTGPWPPYSFSPDLSGGATA